MNILKKCCYRSLRENRKRTLVSVIGIILATALITGVACLAASFRVSLIAYEKEQNGDYHYWFSGVGPENIKIFLNNQNIKRAGIVSGEGYALLEGSGNPDKPYVYLSATDSLGMEAMGLRLTEGRLPQNDSELCISRHIRYNGMVDWKVGDVVTLSLGRRMSEGYELSQSNRYIYDEEALEVEAEKTYTIVGMVERPNYRIEERMAPGYSVFTYGRAEDAQKKVSVFATYTDWAIRHAEQVNAGILGVDEDLYHRYYVECGEYSKVEEKKILTIADNVTENYWLLKWENLSFSNTTARMLYSMAGLAALVIMGTSYFCIRNSFQISVTEKIKLYGRLASVGITSSQQKKIIYYEAAFMGIVGIPVGILSGILATVVLVKIVGNMVEKAVGIGLQFGISLAAVAFAAVLSAVTILVSARRPAGKVAKVSPVSAIRGNDSIRISRREVKCPRFIGRLFGVGGRIAYKNLRRSRTKYRTTVVSIAVSVAVFIGLTSFTSLINYASGVYYSNRQYQLVVQMSGEEAYEKACHIASMDGVLGADIQQWFSLEVDSSQLPYTEGYKEAFALAEVENAAILTLGKTGFEAYCKKLGISVEETEGKAVLLAEYENTFFNDEDGKLYTEYGSIVRMNQGDIIRGRAAEAKEDRELEVEILLQTKEKPMSMMDSAYNIPVLIVSDEWAAEHLDMEQSGGITLYLDCRDAGELEEECRNYLNGVYTIVNYQDSYQSERALHMVLSIFLYGFITVVALIGITSVFNTITTNMELRAPEFAMLQSVGMTGGEFRRMLWLEGLFYCVRSLAFGIPAGLVLSAGFYRALGEGIVTKFSVPWKGIILSGAAVALLLFCITKYSLGKIRRRNIIETIQNENI